VGRSIRVKGSRMGTRFPTLPYLYSEHAYHSSESVHNRMDKSAAWKESEGERGTYLLESTGQMALTSWRVQTDGQVRTRKESR